MKRIYPETEPTAAPPLIARPLAKDELAEFLGVTTRFIETEVKAGRLRAIIIGSRTVRFLPRDVERWLNTRPTIHADEDEEVAK